MAAEAEASREARAKVIAAEGEMKASRALKEASDVMIESPAALQVYRGKLIRKLRCFELHALISSNVSQGMLFFSLPKLLTALAFKWILFQGE